MNDFEPDVKAAFRRMSLEMDTTAECMLQQFLEMPLAQQMAMLYLTSIYLTHWMREAGMFPTDAKDLH